MDQEAEESKNEKEVSESKVEALYETNDVTANDKTAQRETKSFEDLNDLVNPIAENAGTDIKIDEKSEIVIKDTTFGDKVFEESEISLKNIEKKAEQKVKESDENVEQQEKSLEKDENDEEEESEQFFIKYKNRSYMHCDWKFIYELEALDKRAIGKINRYKQKFVSEGINDEEYFNDDYVIVDRVLSDYFDEDENESYAFVKWRSLPYSECTWELSRDTFQSKIKESRKRNNDVDSCKVKERQRPSIHEWEKIAADKVFKDGNTLREYQVEGVNWLLFCYLNQYVFF